MTPIHLMDDQLKTDVETMIATNALRQRYSTARMSFVTLERAGEFYVMRDGLTGSTHQLDVGVTGAPRLFAHWRGFCQTYRVNL